MKEVILALAMIFSLGCGVKGKPLPPVDPVRPGDGTLKSQREQKEREKKIRANQPLFPPESTEP